MVAIFGNLRPALNALSPLKRRHFTLSSATCVSAERREMHRPFAVGMGAVVAVLLGALALLHCCRASGEGKRGSKSCSSRCTRCASAHACTTAEMTAVRVAVFADGAMKYRLQVVTVATGKTDGYRRFMDSAERFNLSVKASVWLNGGLNYTIRSRALITSPPALMVSSP